MICFKASSKRLMTVMYLAPESFWIRTTAGRDSAARQADPRAALAFTFGMPTRHPEPGAPQRA